MRKLKYSNDYMSEVNEHLQISEYMFKAGINLTDPEWIELEPFISKMIGFKDPSGYTLTNQVIDNFIESYLCFKRAGDIKYSSSYINPIADFDKRILNYSEIHKFENLGSRNFDKVVILKLAGGLGTSMGCTYPKATIKVYEDQSFLEIISKQILALNLKYGSNSILWLMSSFNTSEGISKELGKETYKEFLQGAFPKIDVSSPSHNKPLNLSDPESEWNPPGHGDIYTSMKSINWVNQQLDLGKEYVFISNFDNLCATFDPSILGVMIDMGLEFVMETTPKTSTDIKGGSLIDVNGSLKLIEIAQVDESDPDSKRKFQSLPVFNTNNIWINLRSLRDLIEEGNLNLPVIVNNKEVNGVPVVQLESAMGAAIEKFQNTATVVVPRSRFLPIKNTNDLLLLRSDLYTKESDGSIEVNTFRKKEYIGSLPIVELSEQYKTLSGMESRFASIPSLVNLVHLKIDGDIWFEDGVVLEGEVEIKQKVGKYVVSKGTHLKNIRIIDGKAL
jgi:UTP--glucose-1-phosphate uridylyltransferase